MFHVSDRGGTIGVKAMVIFGLSNCLIFFKPKNEFTGQESAIKFFKEIISYFYSKLICFVKVFNIKSKTP